MNNDKSVIQIYKNELIEFDKDILKLTEQLLELKECRKQREEIIEILEKYETEE